MTIIKKDFYLWFTKRLGTAIYACAYREKGWN